MDVWIGLAHVKPKPGNAVLEGAVGAFVPSLALAVDESDYASKVAALLESYDFDVLGLEDVERLDERRRRFAVGKEILALVQGLCPENPVAVSYFDAYEVR